MFGGINAGQVLERPGRRVNNRNVGMVQIQVAGPPRPARTSGGVGAAALG